MPGPICNLINWLEEGVKCPLFIEYVKASALAKAEAEAETKAEAEAETKATG